MLWEMIVGYYKLQPGYSYLEVDKYPIGVKQVLVPMAEGCKKYVAAKCQPGSAGAPEQKRRPFLAAIERSSGVTVGGAFAPAPPNPTSESVAEPQDIVMSA